MRPHRQARRVSRHDENAKARPARNFDGNGEQPGDRRVDDTILDAIDDPVAATGFHGCRRYAGIGDDRPVIVHAKTIVGTRLVPREGELAAIVVNEQRQQALALRAVHGATEQDMAEPRRFGERRGDVGVSGRQLFGDNAAGQLISARAALVLGKRQRTQAELRSLVEQRHRQTPIGGIETIGFEHDRFDPPRDEVTHGLADFQLFGAEMQIVHEHKPFTRGVP